MFTADPPVAHDETVRALMRTAGTTRVFISEDVPDQVLFDAFDAARFAPQAGNLQPVRWIVVRDQEIRTRLGELYLAGWTALRSEFLGQVPLESAPPWVRDADRVAYDFASVPVIAVACAHAPSIVATDADLDRVGVGGEGSIYPAIQNFCLALRSLGVGTAITSALCAEEAEVRKLLGLPDGYLTAAHVAVGYPARPFPAKLARRPVDETVLAEQFDEPCSGRIGRFRCDPAVSTGSFPADLPPPTGGREASALGCAAASRRGSSSRLTTQLPSPWLPNCVLSLPKNDRERIIPCPTGTSRSSSGTSTGSRPGPKRLVGEDACG
ncbi:MAG TPA: nitroreductase family protein [Trebonia sp.]